ncbi:hypothetical protein [Enterococcus sp. DIV1420a]|uniref:hypothetical protein n=1 Tax=Enterococcus TaxID=1350 RepID=UPI003F29BD41
MNKKTLVIGTLAIGMIGVSPWLLSLINENNKLDQHKQKLEDGTNDLNEALFLSEFGDKYNE